jgi:hypothetical protein
MPELRNPGRRDLAAAPAVQYDSVNAHETDYQTFRRAGQAGKREKLAGEPLRARRRTSAGWAIEPRNGLPEPNYRWHARCPGCDQCKETARA